MRESALAWRVEETCLAAWPALQHVLLGDWVLRFSGGFTRRANSANPLRADLRDVAAGIAACEDRYRAQSLPAIFRIPSIVDRGVDGRLQQLGYRAEGEAVTLYGELSGVAGELDGVEITAQAGPGWLAAMAAPRNFSAEERALYGRIVSAIAIPAAFLALRADGEIAALCYGAIHNRLLCCESVFTDARYRRRGHARRLLAALFAWGRQRGAQGVCLQVEAGNSPAQQLYRDLGLTTELYRYHYRRAPG